MSVEFKGMSVTSTTPDVELLGSPDLAFLMCERGRRKI